MNFANNFNLRFYSNRYMLGCCKPCCIITNHRTAYTATTHRLTRIRATQTPQIICDIFIFHWKLYAKVLGVNYYKFADFCASQGVPEWSQISNITAANGHVWVSRTTKSVIYVVLAIFTNIFFLIGQLCVRIYTVLIICNVTSIFRNIYKHSTTSTYSILQYFSVCS